MNRIITTAFAATALVAASSVAFGQTAIPVTGGSFENPDVPAGQFTFGPGPTGGDINAPQIPGFLTSRDVGIHNLGFAGSPAAGMGNTDGDQLLFLGNGTALANAFQDISGSVIGDPTATSYTLTIALATRGGGADGTTPINVGIQNLNGAGNADNAPGITTPVLRSALNNTTFQDFSVTLPAAGVDAGDSIRVFLDKTVGNGLIVADNFRLIANGVVPEPASLGLLGLGGLALLRRRR